MKVAQKLHLINMFAIIGIVQNNATNLRKGNQDEFH